jgi:hypothetical protein
MTDVTTKKKTTGWIPFTAVMLAFLGAFNILAGVSALAKGQFFAESELLFGDLTMWGWIWIVLGCLQALTAWLVLAQKTAGMLMAIAWAFFGGLIHMMSVGAYPIWSVTMVVISFLIMGGLLMNSDEFN